MPTDRVAEIARRAIEEAAEAAYGTEAALDAEAESGDLFSLNSLNSQPATWPDALDKAAFHGLAGEFVEAAQPHSEADPAALLASFLVGFGSAVGPGPHAVVGATRHPARLFVVLVGQSAKARKGESWSPVSRVLATADSSWPARVQQGLSTGEGVIAAVRDRVERPDPKTGESVVIDEGVADKRLLALAPEFGRVLRVMGRDGNTLSAVIREAWDSGELRVMTKMPTVATGAHLGVVGHVSLDELRVELRDVDAASGFANRFLWLVVRRSQMLPDPEPFDGPVVAGLAAQVALALGFARTVGVVRRDAEATELWRELYPTLSADRPGLAGAVLARHEAQAVRLALTYALLDRSATVGVRHLEAAVALLDYCAASATYIFGDRLGDPVADQILASLREVGELTRTAIWADLFGRQTPRGKIEAALRVLADGGLAHEVLEPTGGRPIELWRPGAAGLPKLPKLPKGGPRDG